MSDTIVNQQVSSDLSEQLRTVVKMVDFSYKPSSAILKTRSLPRRRPKMWKAAPPGTLTREHRTGPRSSHPAGLSPHESSNRIGLASPLPQPMLRCKRRSQLSRYNGRLLVPLES